MSSPESIAGDVIRWGVVLLVAIMALGGVAWLARRWLLTAPAASSDSVWSLQHLRELKSQGRISEEEFQTLRAKVIEASGASIRRKAGGSSAASAPKVSDGGK